jgi:hypothetical protein
MQAQTDQLVALVAHGNHVLGGRPSASPWPHAAPFKTCEQLHFQVVTHGGLSQQTLNQVVAQEPHVWYDWLRHEGVRGLRLRRTIHHGPTSSTGRFASSGGGASGRWTLEAYNERWADLWSAHWETGDQHHPERRIWRVIYRRNAMRTAPAPVADPPLMQAAQNLEAVLLLASAFVQRTGHPNAGRGFEAARKVLETGALDPNRHHDLVPQGSLSPQALWLLDACLAALPGGVGSWDDLHFTGADQAEYEGLTKRLTDAIDAGTATAVNTGATPLV